MSRLRPAVTISLVPQARGGPFVFWDDLPGSLRAARECGFAAVEIFGPGPTAFDPVQLHSWLNDHGLQLAALGTGAGWVLNQLQLCAADLSQRQSAEAFIRSMIDLGGPFGAPAIIGSMQGKWGGTVSRDMALGYLSEALCRLGDHARQYNVPLLYEPLNRYETNLLTQQAEAAEFLRHAGAENVQLLCDLFHMNIEEANSAAALRAVGPRVGHVHFVDSNRRPAGCGHIDFAPIATVLRELNYAGYLSAEALPWPDSRSAAEQTMSTFRRFFAATV
jgi:sugar phosphate isomerase/epimerase